MNKVVRSGLRKYHPAFRPRPFHRPINEALEALARVPSDVDKETRRRLPVPDALKNDVDPQTPASLAGKKLA